MVTTEARRIGREELVEVLTLRKGAQPVTFLAVTKPKMLKKHRETKDPNPFEGRVTKVSRVNGFINWRYANSVNRQRERERGDEAEAFEAVPRKWGVRVEGTPFVDHKDKRYVEVKVEGVIESEYRVDGHPIAKEELAAYLPARSESSRQGVEREIVLRDYGLDTITEIAINGARFEVES